MGKPFLVTKGIRYLGVVVVVVLVMSTTGCSKQTSSQISPSSAKTSADNQITTPAPTYKGTEIAEINTTWKGYLDSYMKENPDIKDFNPNKDISKDQKVRVVKIEYLHGLECKNGFYNYALITDVYNSKTSELLSSAGYYANSKN